MTDLTLVDNNPLEKRKCDIKFVNKTFQLDKCVEKLHMMMDEVTKEKVDHKTVNAACNCVNNLNMTIDTVIKAAQFLNEK